MLLILSLEDISFYLNLYLAIDRPGTAADDIVALLRYKSGTSALLLGDKYSIEKNS